MASLDIDCVAYKHCHTYHVDSTTCARNNHAISHTHHIDSTTSAPGHHETRRRDHPEEQVGVSIV